MELPRSAVKQNKARARMQVRSANLQVKLHGSSDQSRLLRHSSAFALDPPEVEKKSEMSLWYV
jgi:hypothetical protein